ncbi:TauD/TfdA family dioxygenase [Pandoraea sp. CB10b_02]|uniref:TauD/TfdA dioxygenase family protein n=1 Tax=Pandoraea sp. CB10b_02 TaxID=2014535 RepID=UPI00257E9024|nr:TauD/TfdA family dioxygenase [Pandoraea sp. CB10b_02]
MLQVTAMRASTANAAPTPPDFVGLVHDFDTAAPVDAETARAIDDAMTHYGVLVFRAQSLTPQQQLDFASALGPLDVGFKRVAKPHNRLGHDTLADISNLDESGAIVGREHRRIVGNIANQLWHSDSSFQRPSARYSMLYAVVVPPAGGQTEFADMRAAFEALPADQQAWLRELKAEHDALHSRFLLGDTEYDAAQRAAIAPTVWPLVRQHPGGRSSLFIGAHASRILGMTIAEGRVLLLDLLEHATQPAFVYRHTWQPGDLVMWDNRCTLHRGRRFDFSQRRELRRATTLDA